MNFKEFANKCVSLPIVIPVVFLGFLVYILFPLLTNTHLIGCDLAPQYYLSGKMLEYVQSFHLSGYDFNWFGGYPAFIFYNPLPYLTVCLLHLLSFKLIPLTLCLNIILFLLPFLFLLGIYCVSQVFFKDKNISLWALFFGFISLFTVSAFSGIGIHAEILIGLFANAFAWPILLFLIASLEKLRQTNQNKYLFCAIGLFSALILSHIFVTIFAFILFLIYAIFYFKTVWKKALVIVLSSLALTFFWWLPFILNIGYTSNEALSVPNDQLSYLYPNSAFFIFLPIVISIIGLVVLIKNKKYFIPTVFLVSFIFLTSNFLADITGLPIHFYRFLGEAILFNIFISAVGANYIFQNLLLKINQKYQNISRALIVWFFILFAGFSLDFFNTDFFNSELFLKSSKHYEETQQIVDYIKNNTSGRIIFDDQRSQLNLNGARHYFDFALASQNTPILKGLLFESSLSGSYIYQNYELFYYDVLLTNLIESSSYKTKTINGNKVGIFDDKIAEKIQIDIKNLSLYGVKDVLVFNNYPNPVLDFANSNYNRNILSIKKTIGIYTLLEIIQDPMPTLVETDYQPFLFVERSLIPSTEQKFKNFSLDWYTNGYSLDYPIIYTKESIDKLSNEDLAHIKGYIVSLIKPIDFIDNYPLPPDKAINCPSAKSLAYWSKANKPVIILNTRGNCPNGFSNIYFVPANNDNPEFLKNILSVMQSINPGIANFTKIDSQILTNEKISFTSSKGVFINFSYFPKWQSNNKNQTVFWATPSRMFVFGKGETELDYK